MTLGPVQLLVVGFDRPDFDGAVLTELERLRESDLVRVIDVLVVHKDADGVVRRAHHPGLAAEGNAVATLIGLGGPEAERELPSEEEESWSLDEAIANDSTALVALIEHRWAIPARDAMRAANGATIAEAWIHPADLTAAGLTGDD